MTMGTSKIENARTGIERMTREVLRLLAIVFIALTIGIIGTLLLEPGSQAHYAFAAILLLATALYL